MSESMEDTASSTRAVDVIRNSTANIDEAMSLGSNIPLIVIAVVMILVLVAITRYF
jgi:hypothetical protein